MMIITRDNYESWLIDMVDGNLSGKKLDMVLDFIDANPDLNDEFQNIDKILLKPDKTEHYPIGKLLKSELDQPDVFQETCIRSVENQLSTKEEADFYEFVNKHPNAQIEYNLFKKTVLKPESAIVYQHKSKLYRSRMLPLYWLSAAAVVVMAVMFWFNANQTQPISHNTVSKATISFHVEQQVPTLVNLKPELKQFNDLEIAFNTVENNDLETLPNQIEDEFEMSLMNPLNVLASTSPKYTDIIDYPYLPFDKNEHQNAAFPTVTELFAEKVTERVNEIDPKYELNRFAFLALNRINNATNDRFDYATNDEGKLNRIGYNSRLLSVNIPINTSK
jgi:hypothetical protein